jgi:putative flippase GtrA
MILLNLMVRKLWSKRFVRFCCAGLINTTLDFAMLNFLVFKIHKSIIVANLISVSIGICISYFLNHILVFQHAEFKIGAFLKFVCITGLSVLCIQTAVIHLANPLFRNVLGHLTSDAGVRTAAALNLAKALAVGVGLGWNYFLYHKLVFAKAD